MQATVCAKFGLPCIIYMGAKDMERQALNVFRMRLLGAEVGPGFADNQQLPWYSRGVLNVLLICAALCLSAILVALVI